MTKIEAKTELYIIDFKFKLPLYKIIIDNTTTDNIIIDKQNSALNSAKKVIERITLDSRN